MLSLSTPQDKVDALEQSEEAEHDAVLGLILGTRLDNELQVQLLLLLLNLFLGESPLAQIALGYHQNDDCLLLLVSNVSNPAINTFKTVPVV